MEVDEQHAFWVHNGPVVKKLEDLPQAISDMDMDSFKHHVNPEKNDFANWVRDVFGNNELAGRISKVKTKKTMAKKIKEALA
ncbi:MAG: hypothetical protein KJ601_01690 [Nanoarchaeota archaeon]|nr:hypothetical protein [Nanoarchaeota archaeon]